MNSRVFTCAILVLVFGAALPAAEPLSFRNDVLPVLSKVGCNSGGCHGSLAGKGGFRLSLNAYDPATDHYNITREMRGRRIEPSAPARSLFVIKPTAAVRHKGGKVIREDSAEYRILTDWIRQGAPAPSEKDARLERLEVAPPQSVLEKGDILQLKVTASFSDGSSRDVTRWVRFASTDASIAEIDEKTGKVTVLGYGEGSFTAWYSGRIAIARVTSPWPNEIPAEVFTKAPKRNVIDERVLEQLNRLNLEPSPPASDSEFLRRAHVDVIGVLPTPAETKAFIEDKNESKRDVLVDKLLARPEFVDYWTYRWSDLFLITGRKMGEPVIKTYYSWLRERVEKNVPWDELVRQVVTASGGSLQNGATNFYTVHQEPESMAENISQAFMSLSIGCAKCHNHPLEKWTNDQYYSFANLFARVRVKGSGDNRTLFTASRGDLLQPRTGKPQPAAPLDAPAIPADSTANRREVLAGWLTSPENPYFTRSIANRIWANFFGRGIVEPVDDLRVSNPASNEPLLAAIAAHLAKNKYDLKALMRLILRSETYRRSSVPLERNREDQSYYSRYYPRRMMAEVLYDAIVSVTSVSRRFDNITNFDGSTRKTGFYPEGTRALQLYDSSVTSYFLKAFGRNDREITCECERSNKPSMVQVLHLSNGNALNDRLSAKKGRVSELLAKENPEIIDEIYMLCFSRKPGENARKRITELFAGTPPEEKRTVVEDLFWALMTSREFLFQH
ncbi:MAG: DUF1553 domain-containing protein [Planctomycetota bacterium]|nr:DUF1553 domain-containing protein [Planctomycetota bacterium]